MTDKWDDDIERMPLTDVEKNGLQVFRNYSKAFEVKKIEKFVEAVNLREIDCLQLQTVLSHIETEDPRFLLVIAAAFIDDHLDQMFRREIPQEVTGGQANLFGRFGPLSSLAQRTQIASAFNWLSYDLLEEAEKIRKLRNDIAHGWDMAKLADKLNILINSRMQKIEEHIGPDDRFPPEFQKELNDVSKLRVRLVWIVGRVFYECQFFPQLVKAGLPSFDVLYSASHPALLTEVASLCVESTNRIYKSTKQVRV